MSLTLCGEVPKAGPESLMAQRIQQLSRDFDAIDNFVDAQVDIVGQIVLEASDKPLNLEVTMAMLKKKAEEIDKLKARALAEKQELSKDVTCMCGYFSSRKTITWINRGLQPVSAIAGGGLIVGGILQDSKNSALQWWGLSLVALCALVTKAKEVISTKVSTNMLENTVVQLIIAKSDELKQRIEQQNAIFERIQTVVTKKHPSKFKKVRVPEKYRKFFTPKTLRDYCSRVTPNGTPTVKAFRGIEIQPPRKSSATDQRDLTQRVRILDPHENKHSDVVSPRDGDVELAVASPRDSGVAASATARNNGHRDSSDTNSSGEDDAAGGSDSVRGGREELEYSDTVVKRKEPVKRVGAGEIDFDVGDKVAVKRTDSVVVDFHLDDSQ